MTDVVMRGRAVKAAVVAVLVVVGIPAASVLAQEAGNGEASRGESWGLESIDVVGSRDLPGVIENLEAGAAIDAREPPDAFSDEVGVPAGARDMRSNGSGSIVGYVLDMDGADAMSLIDEHMALRGWSSVPLGEADGATYVKRSGSCKWALVTCTQVGDATSVVLRCVVE